MGKKDDASAADHAGAGGVDNYAEIAKERVFYCVNLTESSK